MRRLSHKCYIEEMWGDEKLDHVSSRDLRNKTAEIIGRVERGEPLIVTVDRRPVARLEPLPARSVWVPKERLKRDFVQADPGLADDLRKHFTDDTDDLTKRIEKQWEGA